MAIINARAIEPTDVEGVVLRQADIDECLGGGFTPEEALTFSIQNSLLSYAIEVDGELAAFWGYGVSHYMDSTAYAWLLTTPVCNKYPLRFIRTSQRLLRELLVSFEAVEAVVDIRHIEARRWLRWLGFKEIELNPGKTTQFIVVRKGR